MVLKHEVALMCPMQSFKKSGLYAGSPYLCFYLESHLDLISGCSHLKLVLVLLKGWTMNGYTFLLSLEIEKKALTGRGEKGKETSLWNQLELIRFCFDVNIFPSTPFHPKLAFQTPEYFLQNDLGTQHLKSLVKSSDVPV